MLYITYIVREFNDSGWCTYNDLMTHTKEGAYGLVDASHWEYYRIYKIFKNSKPEIIEQRTPTFNKCELTRHKKLLDKSIHRIKAYSGI